MEKGGLFKTCSSISSHLESLKELRLIQLIRKGKEADGSGVNGNRVIYTVLVKKMETKYIIDRKGILETHLI